MGLPFFYWYQLLWVIVSAVITAVVYLATRRIAAEQERTTGECRAGRELDLR
jgi:hypothetical protein